MKSLKSTFHHGNQNIISLLFAALLFFVAFPYWLVTFPTFSASYVNVAWALGTIGTIALIWRNYSSNIWPLGIVLLDWIILFTLCAIRSYSYIFPDNSTLWVIIITLSVLFSYLTPLINFRLTWLLRTELLFPQTPVGRKILPFLAPIVPAVGAIVAINGDLSYHDSRKIFLAISVGTLCWIVAVVIPIGIFHPISPFEKKE